LRPSPSNLSWDDFRYFLVVARSGSANRAATELGVNHTTVTRRIQALEQRLGTLLFQRAPGTSLMLTTEGRSVFDEAEKMEQASDALLRKLDYQGRQLAGEVRIATSDGVASYWLVKALVPFQEAHPEVRISWLMSNNGVEIGRDAEIGLSWLRPTKPDLVGRKLGVVGALMFATREYAQRRGLPQSIEDLAKHALLHFDGYEANPAFSRWNELMRRFPPKMRLDGSTAAEVAMRNGGYIALLPSYSPLIAPDVVQVPIDLGIEVELWLVYHEDQRHHPRVKALATEIGRLATSAKGTWFKL
jgi:DNA-binding transcriptional LysR family regulator